MNFGLTNLTAGEVSPTFLGRPDVGRYANGCQRLENFLLTTTGMWSFRPAFELMGFPKPGGMKVKLWPFQFSDQQDYMLEIGHEYVRIWHSLGQVMVTGTPVEIATAFPVSELGILAFTQSADFLFVVNELRGVFTIKRKSHTEWSISSFALKDGPYGLENTDDTRVLKFTGDPAPGVDIVAEGFPPGEEPWAAGDEGRLVRVKNSSGWSWIILDTIVSPTEAHGQIQGSGDLPGIPAGAPQVAWRMGLYSPRLGYPATVTLHEQRLVLGGPQEIPDRIDGSAVAAFDNFAPGINGGDAYGYALGSKNVNRVVEFGVGNDLIAFTGGSEHRIAGDSTGAAITPTQIFQKPIAPDGVKRGIPPIEVGTAVVFVDKLGLNLRALSFNLGLQSYSPDNLTLLADHMAWLDENSPGFQALCWQGNPIGTIWTIRGNGQLAGCLFDIKEQVLGWHRHPMGELRTEEGGDPVGDSPVVESLATMKGPTHDELWAVVVRDKGDGTELRTIERMGRPGMWDAPTETRRHLDSGLSLRNAPTASVTLAARSGSNVLATLSDVEGGFVFQAGDVGRFLKRRFLKGTTRRGRPMWRQAVARITEYVSPTQVRVDILVPFPAKLKAFSGTWGLTVTTITGLDHLNGFMVTTVSDGRVCEPQLCEGGAIALDVPGWEVHAGLRYEGWMVSLPIDPGPSPVVGQMRPTRVDTISVRLLNSIGGKFAAMPETEDEKLRFDPFKPYLQRDAAPQAPPPAFSGDVKMVAAGAWTKRAEIVIVQDQPLPFNVQLVVAHTYAPFVQP